MNLEKGCRFSSFEDFEKSLEVYKRKTFTEYSVLHSSTLQSIKNKLSSARIQNAPSELKYYCIKLRCIHGGVFIRGKTYSGLRKTSSLKRNCPAEISLKLSHDGRSLIVEELVENHNHEISPENFSNLPKRRRLDPEDQQEVIELFKLNANIRLVKEKYSALTQKNITMKDMYNLAAKARWTQNYFFEATCKNPDVDDESTCEPPPPVVRIDQVHTAASLSTAQKLKKVTACKNPNVEYESTGKHPVVRIVQVPRAANLSTAQKFKKVSALTNKLALLASQSSCFDEQMAFLQSVHDSWANGKVALEIQEKSNITDQVKPPTSQAQSSEVMQGKIFILSNIHVPNKIKVQGQPTGLNTTVIGLNKKKRLEKANDIPSSSSPIVENEDTPNTILGPVDHVDLNSYHPPVQKPSKITYMPIIVKCSEQ